MKDYKKLLFAGIISSTMLSSSTSAMEPVLTPTQLHAVLGVVTNFILDDGITHNGTSYGTVTSPYTGRVWLDKNLGANRVCTSPSDTECYGDYYQWGRGHDGHQVSNSLTTVTQATDVNNVGHVDFIVGSLDWSSVDTNGNSRQKNWFKDDGASICPTGYRVPTFAELKAEIVDFGTAHISNNVDAYNSFLKLPSSGYRHYSTSNIVNPGTSGFIWSDSATPTKAYYVGYANSTIYQQEGKRASGIPVRCIDFRFNTPKKTGQTQSYDSSGTEVTDGSLKDDGFYQKGTTPSYSRDNTKNIVIDHITGLQWQDDLAAATVQKQWLETITYEQCTGTNGQTLDAAQCTNTAGDTAASYCTNLVLGGHTDWRLPTAKEMLGLSDYGQTNPAINATFQNTASSDYSSSTAYAGNVSRAWDVLFFFGSQSYSNKSNSRHVRCVRAGQ